MIKKHSFLRFRDLRLFVQHVEIATYRNRIKNFGIFFLYKNNFGGISFSKDKARFHFYLETACGI